MSVNVEKIGSNPNVYLLKVPYANAVMMTCTNCYLIEDGGESLLVDTGWCSDEGHEYLVGALNELGIDRDRLGIFLTHHHNDHVGLIDSLARPGTAVYTGKRALDVTSGPAKARSRALLLEKFILEGVSREEAWRILLTRDANIWTMPEGRYDIKRLGDGDVVEVGRFRLRVIGLPGHSEGQIGLYIPNHQWLACGDQVLYSITPSLDFYKGCFAENISSLEKMRRLPLKGLLQAHDQLRDDYFQRIDILIAHHMKRAAEGLEAIKRNPGICGRDLTFQLNWSALKHASWDDLSPIPRCAIRGGSLLVLDYLVDQGKVVREVGAGGFVGYRAV